MIIQIVSEQYVMNYKRPQETVY